jgi:hypothetical protein
MGNYQTNTNQQGDVLMFHSNEDCGEILESNGIIEMTTFYQTMAYLTLAGGNQDDDGSEATAYLQWWGNEGEPVERQYRGRFQRHLSGSPLTSASIIDIEADAKHDLEAAFLPDYAMSVSVSASIVAPKMVQLDVGIVALNGETYPMVLKFEATA